MSGKFITLEGIEGSGKSTSLETIQSFLESRDIQYITTKEPGGGSIGKELRSLLLNKESKISSEVELLLMMADRKNHLDNIVLPNLEKGTWVISDRYLDSTYAYQGGGRGIDISKIDNLVNLLNLPLPHLTILFDLSPDIALERAKNRSELDRFEQEPLEFHGRIRDEYLRLSELHQERIKIVDSSLNFDQVESQVTETLSNFLDEE
jgi:dTMP kinase